MDHILFYSSIHPLMDFGDISKSGDFIPLFYISHEDKMGCCESYLARPGSTFSLEWRCG